MWSHPKLARVFSGAEWIRKIKKSRPNVANRDSGTGSANGGWQIPDFAMAGIHDA
jgi:hypothetical protein